MRPSICLTRFLTVIVRKSKCRSSDIQGAKCEVGRRNMSTLPLLQIVEKFNQFKGGSVSLTKDDASGIAEICISNPGKKNAFTGEMMVHLANAVSDLEHWDHGKGVIVYGANGFFCSGGDLDMVKVIGTSDQGLEMAVLMQDTLSRLHDLPLISAALIQGRALGGGAEVTTACDFRLMAAGSEVQFVHTRMGIVPAWGGSTRLVHLMGHVTTLDLLTSCKKLTIEEALASGFASAVMKSEDPLAEAVEWLKTRTTGAPEVVRTAKTILVNARNLSPKESLQKEGVLFSNLWGGPANRRALEANIKH